MANLVQKSGGGTGLRSRRPTLLVVEDNDDQWFITRWAILRTFPDVNIVRTANAMDSLSYLAGCAYDGRPLPFLILLDLYLPDREDGWALLEGLKLHHTFRRIPVVMLSGSANPEDIEQSYYLRGSSYVVKPASYPEWLRCFDGFRQYWLEAVTLPSVA